MKKLTAYELCCGGVQTRTISECELFISYIELYKENSTYHVRAFKRVKGSSSVDRLAWENFDKLTDAREYFTKFR